MNLVKQGPNQCGQACVATITGITLEEATAVFRRKGKTTTKQVKQALWQLGVRSGPKLERGEPDCETALMKFCHPDGTSHWVVWHRRKYYDPAAGVFRKVPMYLKNSKQTSFLRIFLTQKEYEAYYGKSRETTTLASDESKGT